MSLFKKMLASVGIGGARVDTRLESSRVRVGDPLEGVIHIQGGSTEQTIDSIYLHLMTQYVKPQNDSQVTVTTCVEKWKISSPLIIHAGQQEEVSFSVKLPLNTPVSMGRTPIWLQTGLDISAAVDPGDNDRLEVLPHPSMQAVLDAVAGMGFQPKQATCEYSPRLGRGLDFVQELEFYPALGFRGSLKELELVFFVEPGGVEVLVEMDRRARGLTGFLEAALELDERKQLLRFSHEELRRGRQYIAGQLTRVIERHAG